MSEQSVIRDSLAQCRTHLANERTLLAYWRTSLAFFVLGAFLIKFFPSTPLLILAGFSTLFAFILAIISIIRYSKCKNNIDKK